MELHQLLLSKEYGYELANDRNGDNKEQKWLVYPIFELSLKGAQNNSTLRN